MPDPMCSDIGTLTQSNAVLAERVVDVTAEADTGSVFVRERQDGWRLKALRYGIRRRVLEPFLRFPAGSVSRRP